MTDKKIIGIEQYMPMEIMTQEIADLLENGSVDRDELKRRMLAYTKGENRAKKATQYIYQSVTNKTPLLEILQKEYSYTKYSSLSLQEKNIISLAMISLRYPIMYDMLCSFAKLFKLQDTVNTAYIIKTLASMYGNNKTFAHTTTALLTTAVDAGVISRVKVGLYSKSAPMHVNNFVKESWIYTYFYLGGAKPLLVDDLRFAPWMQYLDDVEIDWNKCKLLRIRKESGSKVWIE